MENTEPTTPEPITPPVTQTVEAKPSVVLTTSVETAPAVPVTAPLLPDPTGEPVVDPSALPSVGNDWKWDENMVGEGDRPEWLETKFDSVAEQAKGYKELQKQFQQRQSESAPEEYEIDVTQELKDSGFDVALESPIFKKFEEYAQKKGFPNDTFNEITNLYLEAIQEIYRPLTEEERAVHVKEEMDKLGAAGAEMITKVMDYGKNNLSDARYERLREMCDSAENIDVIKALLDTNIPTAATQQQSVVPTDTRDDLKKMAADPRYGTDMRYTEDVDGRYVKLAEKGKLENRAGTMHAFGDVGKQ